MDTNCKGSEMILLVDDNLAIRTAFAEILKAIGYQVLAAGNSAEAIKIASQYPGTIDLLITDVFMPGMNGVELLKKLLQSRPGIKVLFMSGYPVDILSGPETETSRPAFLLKPVSVKMLTEHIRILLDNSYSIITNPILETGPI